MKSVLKAVVWCLLVAVLCAGCHRAHDARRDGEAVPADPGPVQAGAPSGKAGDLAGSPAGKDVPRSPAAKFEVPAIPTMPTRQAVPIDPAHAYTLPELIDVAQRGNPTTRMAWEHARQAALAVGLVEATYLPELSAQALSGSQVTTFPIPKALLPKGYFTTETNEFLPGLVVKWLLFDFGQREAKAEAARQRAEAATVGFTGAHQKLIFEVSKAYFSLEAIRAQVRVVESALKTAQVLQESAEAKLSHGLATVVEVAAAKRGAAKARYDLDQAKAVENDAYHALLETMGLTPTLRLTIASSAGRPLPKRLSDDVERMIGNALARRPDMAADVAKLRASAAETKQARAAFYPSIGAEGTAYQNIGGISVDNGPWSQVSKPGAGFFLKFSLPVFDGGRRLRNLDIARSKESAAREQLVKTHDQIVREVARTYDALNSSLTQYEAAVAFVEAAGTELEAALEAYRQGVGTLPVAETAETNHAQAQSAKAYAYAGVLTSAAALAFATGALVSSDVLEQQR